MWKINEQSQFLLPWLTILHAAHQGKQTSGIWILMCGTGNPQNLPCKLNAQAAKQQ